MFEVGLGVDIVLWVAEAGLVLLGAVVVIYGFAAKTWPKRGRFWHCALWHSVTFVPQGIAFRFPGAAVGAREVRALREVTVRSFASPSPRLATSLRAKARSY